MKKILIALFFFSLCLTQSFAIMQPTQTYSTEAEFFASGDAPICEIVTNGCNERKIQDGQKGDGIKACKLTADFVYSWSCADYNDDIMFMTGFPVEQNTITILTSSEQTLYDTLKSQISSARQEKIMTLVEKYQEIESKFADEKIEMLREKLIKRIDIVLEKYTGKSISSLLQFLKLEIKLLPLSVENMMTFECSTQDVSYTVYQRDYCIDDMCFPLPKDEIHISDGTYLLPNYIASRAVSASGEKYEATETENGGKYTFWFKENALTVYKNDTVFHECTQK